MAETRAGVFLFETGNTRPESAPQVADSHQGNLACGYELVPGCCLAAETTTLRLPATMTDELPAYQQAADQGLLVKTQSSALPPSNARAIWEANNGPVPQGFDVDHIIQRQFGGTDDLSNLQLKLSGLNRSEGSQAMWLNKPQPYGTTFNNVELAPPR
jgi:hypothetical protein